MILRETLEHRLGAPARLAALAIGLLVLPLAPRPSTAQDPAPKPEAPQIDFEVVLDDLADDDGAFLANYYAALDDAKAEDKDKGDLEARMKRLEARLDKLAALLEAKGGGTVNFDIVKERGPESVVVLRTEQLRKLDADELRVARLAELQARKAQLSEERARQAERAAKLADEAKAGGEAQAAEAEARLKKARAAAERARKNADERQARLGERAERLDQKLQKDARVLQDRVLSLRLPGIDEDQAKKLAAEIDALVKEHAEAGNMSKLAEEIQDVIKKNVAVPPVVERFRQPVRTLRVRPDVRYQKVEPARPGSAPETPQGLDQRMERLEKRLDELMNKLDKPAAPTPTKDDAPAKP